MSSFSRFMVIIPSSGESEKSTINDETAINITESPPVFSDNPTIGSAESSEPAAEPSSAADVGCHRQTSISSCKLDTAENEISDNTGSVGGVKEEGSVGENKCDLDVRNADDSSSVSIQSTTQPSSTDTTPSKEDSKKPNVTSSDSRKYSEAESFLWPPQHFEEILKEILTRFVVRNPIWTASRDYSYVQVTFVVASGRKEEDVLDALLESGIGKADNTSVSISPLTVCMGLEVKKDIPKVTSSSTLPRNESNAVSIAKDSWENGRVNFISQVKDDEAPLLADRTGLEHEEAKLSGVEVGGVEVDADEDVDIEESSFMTSIRSRIIVQPVIASLKNNAEFTFDYLMMVCLASLISAVGLIDSNSVILVASMLISPLMGPILAGVFGQAICDYELRNVGIRSELIGLSICVVTGFLIGLPANFIMANRAGWNPTSDSWPTLEMYGRGALRNLVGGAVIALASGAAVALSVLGANQGSLVGVAISASLLPPAVNTGLLWAFSFKSAVLLPAFKYPDQAYNITSLATNDTMTDGTLTCPELLDNTYTPLFTCNLALDGFLLGSVSFCLTVINIALICVAALLLLKLKQVQPRASVKNECDFWTQHVRVAKNYNTTVRPGSNMATYLVNETKNKLKLSESGAALVLLKEAKDIDDCGELRGLSSAHKTLSAALGADLMAGLTNYRRLMRSQSHASATTDMAGVRDFHRQLSHEPKLESRKFLSKKKMGRFEVETKSC